MERTLREHRVEAILHCGARSIVSESIRDPGRYYRDNVGGGVALLDAARAAGVERLVFSSTAAVYGSPDTTPIPEDAPLRPINPYGETKRAFEGALAWYAGAYGLRSVSLRYFNVAGATDALGEDHDPETHLIPVILGAVDSGPAGDGLRRRLPDPGRDVHPRLHRRQRPRRRAPAGDRGHGRGRPRTAGGALACNLGNGGGFSVRDVLAAAETVVGRAIPVEIGPRRVGDPPVLVASADRAREVLGWTPQRPDLTAMVASAWAWRKRHPGGYPD